MRRAPIFAIAVALLVIILGGIYVARKPIAGAIINNALAGAGFENPKVRVTEFGLGHIEISDLQAGPIQAPSLSIDAAQARFKLRSLLFGGRVEAIMLGAG